MLQNSCQQRAFLAPPSSEPLRRQFFNVDKSQLRCFIEKDTSASIIPDIPEHWGVSGEMLHLREGLIEPREKDDAQNQDSPDLAKEAVDDVIKKIEREGIDTNWSDSDQDQRTSKRSSSPLDSSFSSNNIWRGDWGQNSISNSFYSGSKAYSRGSPAKQAVGQQELSTHRSSLNHSYSSYQPQPQLHMFSLNNSQLYFQQQTLPQPPQYNVYEIGYQNILLDGRTTVMIKNIPNKYSLSAVADEIDATHLAAYDFLYLPLDYNSKCNIGYAFINFLEPESLRSFYEVFNQRKWLKFRSDKICALTYARLQGKHDLIEHFHASKVLTQKGKQYRPIIRDFSDIKDLIAKQKLSTVQDQTP